MTLVRVLDNLSTGSLSNLEEFAGHEKFEFIKGDIRDYQTCVEACEGIDKISHQAALGSVPRSIENPMQSTAVNIMGTVNLLNAAVEQKIDRVVLAFSSSTYGDYPGLPKIETQIGNPLSPYAVTKAANEQFADVFAKCFGLDWIGLRYFNVFGPKQSPNNPYAAVIPLFTKCFVDGTQITVNGDGLTSRDFTYVSNVVQINDLALFVDDKTAINETYNVACGQQTSLNDIILALQQITDSTVPVRYGPEREGDVKHSLADISKAKTLLGYEPTVYFQEGLLKTMTWNQQHHDAT